MTTQTTGTVLESTTITRKNGETVTITLAKVEGSAYPFQVETTYGGSSTHRAESTGRKSFAECCKHFAKN